MTDMKRRGFLGAMLGAIGSAAVTPEAKAIEPNQLMTKCSLHCGRMIPVAAGTPTMVVCDVCSKGKFVIDTEEFVRECGMLEPGMTGDTLKPATKKPFRRNF